MGRPSLAAGAALLIMGLSSACSDSNNSGGQNGMPPPAPPPANTESFDVTLNAGEVVGGGAASGSASASLTLNKDDGSLSGSVTLSGVDADGVSLRNAFAGDVGPMVVDLEQSSATQWAIPDGTALTADQRDALDSGALYLEVTSSSNPDGALRGQITDQAKVLFVRLSGMQEVPPLDTAATAMAAVTLEPDDSLIVHMHTSGLDDAVEAHIHNGEAGVNGPIVIGLVQDPDDVSHWSTNNTILDQSQLDVLNDGDLYLNVHTPAHQAGEVRGQIAPDGVDVFFTRLTGGDVVPPVTTNGSGVAAATVRSQDQTFTLHVNLLGLDDATAATVRQAPVMQNGPVTLRLQQDANDVAHWALAATMLTDAQSQALRNQGLYVSVATPAFADGEVRGQLVPPMSTAGDGSTFLVSTVSPADGSTVSALPASVTASFNRDVLAASAGIAQVHVTASGGDGSFGDGNEVAAGVLDVTVSGSDLTADIDNNAAGDDVYRITLDGTSANPITDTSGVVLDGDADGQSGGDFTATFTVDSSTAAPTLTELQTTIFTPSCAKSGCHAGSSPAQGQNLSAGQTFSNVVGVPSNEVPSLNRVEPGDPDNSYLVRKVMGTASAGSRMPLDGPPFLTNAQIQSIRDWISAGAKNN